MNIISLFEGINSKPCPHPPWEKVDLFNHIAMPEISKWFSCGPCADLQPPFTDHVTVTPFFMAWQQAHHTTGILPHALQSAPQNHCMQASRSCNVLHYVLHIASIKWRHAMWLYEITKTPVLAITRAPWKSVQIFGSPAGTFPQDMLTSPLGRKMTSFDFAATWSDECVSTRNLSHMGVVAHLFIYTLEYCYQDYMYVSCKLLHDNPGAQAQSKLSKQFSHPHSRLEGAG